MSGNQHSFLLKTIPICPLYVMTKQVSFFLDISKTVIVIFFPHYLTFIKTERLTDLQQGPFSWFIFLGFATKGKFHQGFEKFCFYKFELVVKTFWFVPFDSKWKTSLIGRKLHGFLLNCETATVSGKILWWRLVFLSHSFR